MVILIGQETVSDAETPAQFLNSELGDDIIVNKVWEGESNVFSKDDEVTLTRINRAKGNEAAMVYVTGLEYVDSVSSGNSLVQRRNEIFVAMTRTRGWCQISGVGNCDPFDELQAVLNDVNRSNPRIKFQAPDPQSLENKMEDDTIGSTLDEFQSRSGLSDFV